VAARVYWLDLFTGTTWQEFLEAGGEVTGFREERWSTVQQIKPGDLLLCYLTGASRWIGVLEVISEPFRDETRIWKDSLFPCRVRVKTVAKLTPDTAVPITELKEQLSIFQGVKSPIAWTGHLRGSPAKWKDVDGQAIVAAVLAAQANPIVRPVDQSKMARRHRLFQARFGSVTIPGPDEPLIRTAQVEREQSAHDEIQWRLLNLGNNMGLDVWAARNDRGRTFNGERFSDLPRLRKELPRQFDDKTNRTIELIDVLWLRGNAFVAAFEIESTTSIYSGLLRMSDLISMQPNLSISLFLVAPDERREKVIEEVNRPTFSRLSPPMNTICRFISFSAIRGRIPDQAIVPYLKPDFLNAISESCN
jgi:hypothetical protein